MVKCVLNLISIFAIFSPQTIIAVDDLQKSCLTNSASIQKKCFVKLLNEIKKGHVSLIIIDGIAMLYRLELGDAVKLKGNVKEFNRDVSGQMRVLSEISRKQRIPIIITNQVYSGFLSEEDWKKGVEKEVNIVGGDLFKYWSKCIIELRKENRKKKAILLKHRSLPNKEINFDIRAKGIFKRGWI